MFYITDQYVNALTVVVMPWCKRITSIICCWNSVASCPMGERHYVSGNHPWRCLSISWWVFALRVSRCTVSDI